MGEQDRESSPILRNKTQLMPERICVSRTRVSNARLFVGAAASVRLSRAPHFSSGNEHPAALGRAVFFSGGVEQPAAQHVLHQKQAVRQSIICVRACVRVCMCSHTQRRAFSCHFQTNVISFKAEVGGGKQSGAEAPTRNPSSAPSASAPHARHDRSMARSGL